MFRWVGLWPYSNLLDIGEDFCWKPSILMSSNIQRRCRSSETLDINATVLYYVTNREAISQSQSLKERLLKRGKEISGWSAGPWHQRSSSIPLQTNLAGYFSSCWPATPPGSGWAHHKLNPMLSLQSNRWPNRSEFETHLVPAFRRCL